MDYMIFFAIWIIGGIAFFLANRVKPMVDVSTDTNEGDVEDSEDDAEEAEEADSEESSSGEAD